MTAVFKTFVLKLDSSPLGLLAERWVIEHWCTACRQNVGAAELLAHAQAHDAGQPSEPGPPRTGLRTERGASPCSSEPNKKETRSSRN
jgi:hypothetical protein